jgi:NAD(P)-dependent dehydrogenase (short-subunit alcohol dehydrogenase family)
MKKVIIITGANGGIGKEACNTFIELGYRVIGLDLKFDDFALAYDTFVIDLLDEEKVKKIVDQVYEKYNHIDVLFSIAGGSCRKYGDGPIDSCTLEGFRKTLDINLVTMFIINKYVIQKMMLQNFGCVINTSSVLGMQGGGKMFSTHGYAASKAAIIGLSKAMASQYTDSNIRVNVIAPGLIKTPMSKRAQTDDTILDYMKIKQPIYANRKGADHLGHPRSIVKAAEFLASDEADFITGIVIPVDGGWLNV